MNNTTMNDIRKYLCILNVILVAAISCLLLFTPNIKIYISNTDVSKSIVSVILIIFMILLAFLPLKRNTTMLSIISLSLLTIGSIHSIYELIIWLNATIEGSYYYRFFTIIKTATLENKLTLYHQLIKEALSVISLNPDNMHLVQFLEKSPIIMEPYTTVINYTPYQDLKYLVTKTLI